MKKHFAQYKDSIFRMLFNNSDRLRRLYNALTGSSYGEETPVAINTLNNVFSMSMRNDVSFTIGDKTIVLIEHQSTINPNMPVRFFIYLAAIYENIIPKKDLYSSQKLQLPCPEFYLFYNGTSSFPENTILKLSDSFEKVFGREQPPIELVVKAYNINAGYNKALLAKSNDLDEYVKFVAWTKAKQTGCKTEEERAATRTLRPAPATWMSRWSAGSI